MLSGWRTLFAGLFRRSRAEAELDEELSFHLESRIADLVARGVSADEAARRARLEFGGVALHKDRSRDALGWRVIDELRADLTYGFRGLLAHRVFTLVAVLTLALGIGANTVMFGVLDALLLRPPSGIVDPGAIVRIYPEFRHPTGNIIIRSSFADFEALERQPPPGITVAAYSPQAWRLGNGDDPDSPVVRTIFISHDYFPVLRVRPELGRFFTNAEQATEAAAHVAIISDGLWRSQFGADPQAIGKPVVVAGLRFRVVGIMPPSFTGIDLDPADIVWLPAVIARNDRLLGRYMRSRAGSSPETYRWLLLMARLAPGASRARLSAQVATRIAEAERAANDVLPPGQRSAYHLERVTLASLTSHFGAAPQKESPVSLWFLAVTGVVLLIACANMANLLLARAISRRHEVGVRLAIGASRSRIIRQLLVESGLLAALAGLAALALTVLCTRLVALLPLPPIGGLIDWRVMTFAAMVSLLATLLFGVIPAFWATSHNDYGVLKTAGSTTSGRSRLRSALLVTQLALSLALLVAAGLFIRSLEQVERDAPGFNTRSVVLAELDLEGHGYSGSDAQALEGALLTRLRHTPSVSDAALASSVAFTQWSLVMVGIPDGTSSMGPAMPVSITTNAVGPDFFRTLHVPLLRGRGFTERDRTGAAPVAIVSGSMAHRFWPDGHAVGRCVFFPVSSSTCTTIVGVVGNLRYQSATDRNRPALYRPLAQMPTASPVANLLIRANGSPAEAVATIRSVIRSLDPKLSRITIEPFERAMDRIVIPWRVATMLTGAFGLLAFALAAVGLAGLMLFLVSQRTREIGVRLALGATRADVVGLVLRDGLRLMTLGVLVGLCAAVGVSRLLASRLYEVSPLDPVAYAGAAVLLTAVALIATYLPARRAAAVDPAAVLRSE